MARHILVKTQAEAQTIKQQLSQGQDFAKLAKKHSLCASGKKGGGLGDAAGEVRKGQMVKAIDTVIFKKPTNIVHGPIKTQFGFHLVEVIFRD